jgi:hypothetical protein
MTRSSVLVIVEEAIDINDAISEALIKLEPFDTNAEVEATIERAMTPKEYRDALVKLDASFGEQLDNISFENPTEEEADDLTGVFAKLVEVHNDRYYFMSLKNENGRWNSLVQGGSVGTENDRVLPSKHDLRGVDVIQKKDLDFTLGEELSHSRAVLDWHRYLRAVGDTKIGPTLEDIIKQHRAKGSDLDGTSLNEYSKALLQYQQNKWVKLASSAAPSYVSNVHEHFFVDNGGREAFLSHAKTAFVKANALLTPDDEWVDGGHPSSVADERPASRIEWDKTVRSYIDDASDNTWFLMYTVDI